MSAFDRPPEFLASYFTLAGDIFPFATDEPARFSLQARAEAAAEAGYVGMGIEARDLRFQIERLGYREMGQIFRDCGMRYVELEVLTDWFADGDRRKESDSDRELFLKAAAELGAAKIKILGDAAGGLDWDIARDNWPMCRQAEALGILARQAAQSDTAVTIELVPGTGVSNLETAFALIEGASEANVGLLVDIWHLDRCGIQYEDILALPDGMINAVEIDDARKKVCGTIFDDTVRNRLLPGEGELDVVRFLKAVFSSGYESYFGVEIVSDKHRGLSLKEAAKRSFDATMAQFSRLKNMADTQETRDV